MGNEPCARNMISETITAKGHPLVKGTHKTTIEVTKESHLTQRGDCIIGVSADKACVDLSEELKTALKSGAKFKVIFRVSDLEDSLTAYGSPDLKLTNMHDIVIRKSAHIDDRTILIKADKAAWDLKKSLVKKLEVANELLELTIEQIIS